MKWKLLKLVTKKRKLKYQLEISKKQISEMKLKIEQDKYKVEYVEKLEESRDNLSISETAKLIKSKIPHLDLGQKKLFEYLRSNGILMSDNIPKQEYINRGYFKVTESVWDSGNKTHITRTTKVTGKGITWLTKRLNVNN